MLKRILSIVLVITIMMAIAFQCSTQSSAIAGVDDVVVLGVCLDLLALGISIYNVSDFCQSDTFADLCRAMGEHVDTGISTIVRNGKLFLATTKLAWQDICSWVKSKFSGLRETKDIDFDVVRPSHPEFITLKDGTTAPWATFMTKPFFIYKLPNGTIRAWYCDGDEPGVNIMTSMYRILCKGHGKCYRYFLTNGAWGEATAFNMTYGTTYKGVTGSFYDISYSSTTLQGQNLPNLTQYRTMDKVMDNGTSTETAPPNTIPDGEGTTTATVTMTSDPVYYPGAVDSPVETISTGEQILIEVPDSLVTYPDTTTPTLTNDLGAIANELGATTSADVKPRVLTNTVANTASIDSIIADTPANSIVGDATADIETANKFRLPKSFLEGFPFSIPYSVYAGITSFLAEPEAPSFSFPFSIPVLGIFEDVTVDLSSWNPVARLCRAFLSVVWIAGLAYGCSKYIRR